VLVMVAINLQQEQINYQQDTGLAKTGNFFKKKNKLQYI